MSKKVQRVFFGKVYSICAILD